MGGDDEVIVTFSGSIPSHFIGDKDLQEAKGRLGFWRSTVHSLVARLGDGEWASRKASSMAGALDRCKRCGGNMSERVDCTCHCLGCRQDQHKDCKTPDRCSRACPNRHSWDVVCRHAYVKLYNQVRICSPARMPKLSAKEKERAHRAVSVALMLLGTSDSPFLSLPRDVSRLILALAFPHLRVRRRRRAV